MRLTEWESRLCKKSHENETQTFKSLSSEMLSKNENGDEHVESQVYCTYM